VSFPLKDVRFTTRRAAGEVAVYPRLLRDRSVLPKIDIAVQYFENMLGSERRSLDPEVLVHFFGDHKLARCMVACLARAYRYRARDFDEIVTRAGMRKLQRRGLTTPRALRASVYERLNGDGSGYLGGDCRADWIAAQERELALRAGELERLLYLDSDEHAVLGRVGEPPRPDDVVAQHNVGVLTTLLRHAELVELEVSGWSDLSQAGLLALAAANGVDAEFVRETRSTGRARLLGRQDALGTWTRHGRRLARAVLQLLERARATVLEGRATVWLKERRVTLRLNGEVLDILCGRSSAHGGAGDSGWDDEPGWAPLELATAFTQTRAAGDGARLRRMPEPSAWAAGVALPGLQVQLGRQRALVCVARSAIHGERLARLAPGATSGDPLLFLGTERSVAPLRDAGAWTLALERPDLRSVVKSVAERGGSAPDARVA
jgi:hypothetical protein